MAQLVTLQNLFNSGMKRDAARNRMAPNTVWNMVDYIVDYDAPARERGGWANFSALISSVTASASYVRGGIFATFSTSAGELARNLCVDEDGLLYHVAQNGTVTLIGSARTIAQNPVFHGGAAATAATAVYTGLVIIPDGLGVSVPMKYDGTTLSALGGSPPAAKYATVYKNFTVLANGTVDGTVYPNRIWFGPAGDPDAGFSGSQTAWDTTDSWIDFSLPIKGLASTKNAMLVFHTDRISRVRGSSPPPDEDMVVDDPYQKVGLLDAFSITEHQDLIYWCAPEGVFRTDGVSLDDITIKGGMLRYWLDLTSEATSAFTFATGIVRDNLIVCVMNGTEFVDAFMINLQNYGWSRLSNLDAVSFWDGLFNTADEEYFARRGLPHVGRLDTMFRVDDPIYKADGNGTAVAGMIETAFFEMGSAGLKVLKSLFLGYSLVDHASDNPSITVEYITTPEEDTYTALGSLEEQSAYVRRRIQIGGRAPGIGLRLQRVGAGDHRGYDIAIEATLLEDTKRL